jgi:putative ABC transporter-associated repeat protein
MRPPEPHPRHRPRRWSALALAAAILAALAVAPAAAPAWADTTPPPGGDPLQQTIPVDVPIVHGPRIISTGHVDIGPKFDQNSWKLLIHDDAHRADANAQSVWRYPAETVLQVNDAAKLTVPTGDTYSFIGAAPGSTVWVVPQTQNPAVVWAGWNTQDPTVMQRMDRGATFSVDGVQGPGTLTVYLQSGDFGAPQVLWDSRKSGPQDVFVDNNTHTHANWVFTKPGVYLVRMTVAAGLIDGTKVSDTELLRFAVGSATPTDAALQASWKGAVPSSPASGSAAASASASASGAAASAKSAQSPLVPILIVAIIVVAAALIVGFTIVIVRSNRTQKRILAERAAARKAAAGSVAAKSAAAEDAGPQDGAGA